MTTAYTNRDNQLHWQIEIDGEPPVPGEITRVVIAIGDQVLDSDTDSAISLDPTGIVTLNLNGQELADGDTAVWLTAYTAAGQQLAIARLQITLRTFRPAL